MRNIVLEGVRKKILQTCYIEKSYSTAYFNIAKFHCIRSFTKWCKISICQKKYFKNGITQNFLVVSKSSCFNVELSKENLLQLNMSKKDMKALIRENLTNVSEW